MNIFPNPGEVISQLLDQNTQIEKLPELIQVKVGTPVKPMLSSPVKGMAELIDRFGGTTFTCEYKYDGMRGQIHLDRSAPIDHQVKIYSRNLENMTRQFPELHDIVRKLVRPEIVNCIIDAEIVAVDPVTRSLLPF